METIFTILGVVAGIAGFVCWILILIDAFQDSILKGFIGLLCGLYLLYYSLFEFEHDNKWIIILGAFGGSGIAAGFFRLAGG
ncbi:MAG: hypothetical protein ACO1SV_01830 [Fimbriimonas sp.]